MNSKTVLFVLICLILSTIVLVSIIVPKAFSFEAKILELSIQPVSTNFDQITFKIEREGTIETLSWQITRLDASFAFEETVEIKWRTGGYVTIYSTQNNPSPLNEPFFLKEVSVVNNPSVFASTDIFWLKYRWRKEGELRNFISITRSLNVKSREGELVVMHWANGGHVTITPAD